MRDVSGAAQRETRDVSRHGLEPGTPSSSRARAPGRVAWTTKLASWCSGPSCLSRPRVTLGKSPVVSITILVYTRKGGLGQSRPPARGLSIAARDPAATARVSGPLARPESRPPQAPNGEEAFTLALSRTLRTRHSKLTVLLAPGEPGSGESGEGTEPRAWALRAPHLRGATSRPAPGRGRGGPRPRHQKRPRGGSAQESKRAAVGPHPARQAWPRPQRPRRPRRKREGRVAR
ncbi:unnamed protein product [Prorocentrum cordatum]|uniref:Uncharacterized protein n=1 Tax=Prorocentrum cordatum TaxID=2364126 RepID=A0ABN9W4D7_9DINO|nr:unnamed protein product [Polarella glacialis]